MRYTIFILMLPLLSPGFVPAAENDADAKLKAALEPAEPSRYAVTEACRTVGARGTNASIPLLAKLLTDERFSHPARLALQEMPGDAATRTLCEAVFNTDGKILHGIIGSLGERGDPKALNALVEKLVDPNDVVAGATALALGKIGGEPALSILKQKYSDPDFKRKRLLGEGLVGCAESLEKQGKSNEAVQVYALIRNGKEFTQTVHDAAVLGEIRIRNEKSGKILLEEMTGADDSAFLAALEAARQIDSPELTPVLLEILPKLDASRKAVLFDLLGRRGDRTSLDTILESAEKENDLSVRNAAVLALSGFPEDRVVDRLWNFMLDEKGGRVAAAVGALARMKADGLDATIVERAAKTEPGKCGPICELCAKRNIASSLGFLKTLLNAKNETVRLAAISSLGTVLFAENAEILIEHLAHPLSSVEFQATTEALRSICIRTVSPDALVEKIATAYDSAPTETKIVLLDYYDILGGPKAIEALRKTLAGSPEPILDAATRVLGNWPTPDAAPVLMDVMRNPEARTFHNRALRGYIRIVRQMDSTNEQRLNMCLQALELAVRNEEKLLLIDALGRIPTTESLEKIMTFVDTPDFTEVSCRSAVAVGKLIAQNHRTEAKAAMQKVIQRTKNDELRRQANEIANSE